MGITGVKMIRSGILNCVVPRSMSTYAGLKRGKKPAHLGNLARQRTLQRLLIHLGPGLGHDGRPHFFAILGVLDAERDGLGDTVEREQGRVQLDRGDFLAAAVDELLSAKSGLASVQV